MKKRVITLLLCVICLIGVFAFASCSPAEEEYTGSGEEFTITFNPAGGTLEGETEIILRDGEKVPEPVVEREGYVLTGWYSGKSKNTKWDFDEDRVSKDMTLTAWWAKQSTGGQVCEHTYELDASKQNKQPTCTESGKLNYICTKCTAEDYEVLPKLGHDLAQEIIPPTCGAIGYTREYCKREGCTYSKNINEVNATGDHDWGDYVTILQATKYTDGVENRTCKACGTEETFPIKAFYKPIDFKDLAIGNFIYTGGSYVNEPFVNISGYAGTHATSYYTICLPSNAVDGDSSTYWSADTLADGTSFTGEYLEITFDNSYDIGAFNVLMPYYSSWGLGDDCYVSFDIMAKKGEEWVKVGELNDKEGKQSGVSSIVLEQLSEPVNTNALRFVVSHSSRYAPAIIYELEIMAKAPKTERVPSSLVGSALVEVSGSYNSWAGVPEQALDGSNDTFWFTDSRHRKNTPEEEWHEVYMTLDFSTEKYLAAVQFTVTANVGKKEYTICYWKDNAWVEYQTVFVEPKNCSEGGQYGRSEAPGVGNICTFLIELNVTTSKVKLVENVVSRLNDADYKVCEFLPLTILERAHTDFMESYQGCVHNYKQIDENGDGKRNDKDVIPATCDKNGYTRFECTKCGAMIYTDATDALGHTWGEFEDGVQATATTLGTKVATCTNGCGATRTKHVALDYEAPSITTYFHNATAGYFHTFDDGNYIETYEWVIPRLQKYNYRATAVLTIGYISSYVSNWQNYFSTGAFDLGSHSYTHDGIYGAGTNEKNFLAEVNKAHYWFMNNFAGQRLLTFATPGGTTSASNAQYLAGFLAANRNGGGATIDNKYEDLVNTLKWGDINCYASRADATEGLYFFVKDGKFLTDTKYAGALNLSGSFGKPQTGVNDKGQPVYGEYGEWIEGANVLNNGGIEIDADGNPVYDNDYIVIKTLTGYVIRKKKDLAEITVQNYVYNPETNRLAISTEEGTYVYNAETYTYEWKTTGSYVDRGGELVYDENDNSGYKLYHVEIGSYETLIDRILDNGSFIVDCVHSLGWGSIYSSYASTISKFEYLKKTGVWCGSFTDAVMYGKETQKSTLDLISQTETEIKLELTDTLDDFMFNHALTVKVDIPDNWTSVTVMQGDKAIEYVTNEEYKDDMTKISCTIIDGYLYVDVVPDQGVVTITGEAE